MVLDLLVVASNRCYGFEVIGAAAPRMTALMLYMWESTTYAMAGKVHALPASNLITTLWPL